MWSPNPHSPHFLSFQHQNTCNNIRMPSGHKAICRHFGKEAVFLLWWKWEISTLILYLCLLLPCCSLSGFKVLAAIGVCHTLQESIQWLQRAQQLIFKNSHTKFCPIQTGHNHPYLKAGLCPFSWTTSEKWLSREGHSVSKSNTSSQKWIHQWQIRLAHIPREMVDCKPGTGNTGSFFLHWLLHIK